MYRSADGGARILLADFDSGRNADNNFGSRSPLKLESLIAPGDSGGGLFENINGQSYLTGITSFGWGRLDGTTDSDYGDVGGWTRVSSFNSWMIASSTALHRPPLSRKAVLARKHWRLRCPSRARGRCFCPDWAC